MPTQAKLAAIRPLLRPPDAPIASYKEQWGERPTGARRYTCAKFTGRQKHEDKNLFLNMW